MGMGRDRHDELFKKGVAEPAHLAVVARSALPASLSERVDWDTLRRETAEFPIPGMSPIEGDVLASADLVLPDGDRTRVFLLFLVEHQSTVDETMPVRLYGYQLGAFTNHLRDRRSQGQALFPLPPVICIVVHHSASGWTAARSLHSLFDPRLIALPDVARYLPNFELIVDDLSHASAAQILGRAAAPREQPAALILLGLRFGRSALEFFRELLQHSAFVESVAAVPGGLDALRLILEYLEGAKDADTVMEELRQAIEESHASLTAKGTVMSIADQLRALGRKEGIAEGMEQGIEQGIEKGIEKDIEKGERAVLRKQLRLKFGPLPDSVLAKLDAATAPELERWAERVLTATTLDAVLGD